MTAYQGANMPNPSAGGFGLSEMMQQARAEQRQAKLDAWTQMVEQGRSQRADQEMQMQQQHMQSLEESARRKDAQQDEDRAAEIAKETYRLYDSGLPLQAEQLAKLHGFTINPQGQVASGASAGQPQAGGSRSGGAYLDSSGGVFDNTGNLLGHGYEPGKPEQGMPIGGGQYNGRYTNDPNVSRDKLAALGILGPGGRPQAASPAVQQPPTPQQPQRGLGNAFVDQTEVGRAALEFPDGSEANVPGGGVYHEGQSVPIEGPQQAPPPEGDPPVPGMAPPPPAQPTVQGPGQNHPMFRYSAPGGAQFTVDPMEREAATHELNKRRAEQFRAAFAQEPAMAGYAGEFGARAELGEQPQAIFADLRARQTADAKERQKTADDKTYRPTVELQDEWHRRAEHAATARAGQGAAFKSDTANRQDMGSLRQEFKDWKASNQLNVDSKLAKRLHTISANIDSGNAMQQREAAESLVAVFKGGGAVTKASQDLLLKHLSGIVGDAQTFVQHLATGHYGAQELAVLKQAAHGAEDEMSQQAKTYYQSAIDTFGPGSGWENLGGNVNHMVKGEFRQFGLDVPDVYEGAGGVTLGSGKRPKGGGHAPAAGGKVTTVHMPDGSVQRFDASGQPVK